MARETAFSLIYETEFNRDIASQELFETEREVRGIQCDDYIQKVFFGVADKYEELDAEIADKAKGWKSDRLSKVTRAILRLCVYEMLYCDDIPYNISINEAVELAKRFDHDKAPAFVNGIANKIAEDKGLKIK